MNVNHNNNKYENNSNSNSNSLSEQPNLQILKIHQSSLLHQQQSNTLHNNTSNNTGSSSISMKIPFLSSVTASSSSNLLASAANSAGAAAASSAPLSPPLPTIVTTNSIPLSIPSPVPSSPSPTALPPLPSSSSSSVINATRRRYLKQQHDLHKHQRLHHYHNDDELMRQDSFLKRFSTRSTLSENNYHSLGSIMNEENSDLSNPVVTAHRGKKTNKRQTAAPKQAKSVCVGRTSSTGGGQEISNENTSEHREDDSSPVNGEDSSKLMKSLDKLNALVSSTQNLGENNATDPNQTNLEMSRPPSDTSNKNANLATSNSLHSVLNRSSNEICKRSIDLQNKRLSFNDRESQQDFLSRVGSTTSNCQSIAQSQNHIKILSKKRSTSMSSKSSSLGSNTSISLPKIYFNRLLIKFNYFVIDPDDNGMFLWLIVLNICILYNVWFIIARQSFEKLQASWSDGWFVIDVIADIIYLIDVILQFRTGYLEQGLLVYNSKKLALNYIKSKKFLFDMFSLLPFEVLHYYVTNEEFGSLPILRFPRFFKSYRSFELYYITESRTLYPNVWRVCNLTHILFLLGHWFAGFYFMISKAEGFKGHWSYPEPKEEFALLSRMYLRSLYWSTLTLTTIGDLPPPETNWQYLFSIAVHYLAVFVIALIVGQVGNVITNRNANRVEFERLLDGAKQYMRNHNVPTEMQKRVQRWYDYSWSRGRMNGSGDIHSIGLLPDKLKTELALHVNLDTLKKVTIFQECQPEFLHDLVLKMRAYIFTPGDLICRKGEVAREMFIIADGVLEVIGENYQVLTKMYSGDFFGEIGILNIEGASNRRTADVRSVGYAELFSLSKEDVLSAVKDYPEAERILIEYGKRRLNQNNARAQSTSKISSELMNVVAMASAAAAAAALGSPTGLCAESKEPAADGKTEDEADVSSKKEAAQTDTKEEKPKQQSTLISITESKPEVEASKMMANAKNSCRETLQIFQELATGNSNASNLFPKTSKTCSNLSAPVNSHINAQRCSLDLELGLNISNEECRGLTTDVLGLPVHINAVPNSQTMLSDLVVANLARKEEIFHELAKKVSLTEKDSLVIETLDNICRECEGMMGTANCAMIKTKALYLKTELLRNKERDVKQQQLAETLKQKEAKIKILESRVKILQKYLSSKQTEESQQSTKDSS